MARRRKGGQDPLTALDSLRKDLDADYKLYLEVLPDVPLNFQGHLHQYMCIRIAGFLEQTTFMVVKQLIANKSSPDAGQFALSFFRSSPNLTPDAFETLWLRFGSEDPHGVKGFLDLDERRELMGNLLRVRNYVAHGKSYGGGKMQVDSYRDLANGLYDWMLAKLL